MSSNKKEPLKKHQHFVPQSYLKHWSDKDEQLFVYRFAQQKEFHTNKRNVAGQKFAYDTELTLNRDNPETFQFFENQFGKFETEIQPVFEEIHKCVRKLDSSLILPSSYAAISKENVNLLVRFMVIQIFRGMKSRERMTKQWNDWCRRTWNETAPILFPDESLEDYFDEVCGDWIKHSQMEFLFTRLDKFSGLIEEKIAVFGLVKGTDKLYTSDNPVHWTGYMLDPTVMWDGILSPSCRIVYALAPDVCAIFYDRDFYTDQLEFDRASRILQQNEIREFNHHLVLQANTEIYSCDGNFASAKFTLAQKKISGEKWHGTKSGDESFEDLLELLKKAAEKVPKGYYTKERWLSIIRQEGNLPFGKM